MIFNLITFNWIISPIIMKTNNYNPEIELNKHPQPIDMEQMDIIKKKWKSQYVKF